MYLRRVIKRSIRETVKFWTLHRNWTVIAAPVGAIIWQGLSQGWNSLPKNIPDTVGKAAVAFGIGLIGTFLINVVRTPKLLDVERESEAANARKEIEELKLALEKESFNLANAPQMILGFNQEFFIRNIGQVDGRDGRIDCTQINDLLLFSEQVKYIGCGDTVFELKCRRKNETGSPVLNILQRGEQAFRMFIEEVIRSAPLPDAIANEPDQARKATREYQYLAVNDHKLKLNLIYSDFAGHQYVSPAIVAWTIRDGGHIVSVAPQTIRKLTAAEAQQWNAGQYLPTVAGIDVFPDPDGAPDCLPAPVLISERRLPL